MNRRLLTALGASALLIAAIMPAAAVAKPPAQRFQRHDMGSVDPELVRQFLAGTRTANVMIELAAKPIALRQADSVAAGRKLDNATKVKFRTALRASQNALDGRIKAAGGRILGKYQDAYNGIKVRIDLKNAPKLAKLPGVVAVRPLAQVRPDNVNGVPFIGAPAAWQDYGFTGSGVKIAVIDTGIDYTHANFGGPGTVAAFTGNDPTVIEAGTFPTTKVVVGFDFAGNNYDASGDDGSPTPTPDPDPLDCFGHGSHVAGTAAGFGITSGGATYTGPYNGSVNFSTFSVGPGVAPQATLYAYKVFGCAGSTDLTVDAINAAVAANVDVINMSLGSSFGREDDPSAVASNNAALAGVVVVASAGNSGPSPYITGAPATAIRAISTAALDAMPTFPSASVDLPSPQADQAGINMNASTALPLTATLAILNSVAGGAPKLGCDAADYAGVVVTAKIVVIKRGVCAFVDKGALAEAQGAAGIVMVNRDDVAGLPVFLGSSPEIFDIPMVGVAREAQPDLILSNGQSASLLAGATVANPTFKTFATFTSGGPRELDSALKPDVTAPGISIVSTLSGSGNRGTTLSGTSMASPHNAGVAALVVQAHPAWPTVWVKAAIMNTANPKLAIGYDPLLGGSGIVQPRKAVDSVTVATTGGGTASLSYGYEPSGGAFSETRLIQLTNTSTHAITYKLSKEFVGSAHGAIITITPSAVTVAAHRSKSVKVKISLSKARVAALPSADDTADGSSVTSIRGAILAKPTKSGTGRYTLRVPFLLVPRGLSNVTAAPKTAYQVSSGIATTTVKVRNSGVHTGAVDVFSWGQSDGAEGLDTTDVKEVGAASLPGAAGGLADADRLLLFNVNFNSRWGSPSDIEIDIDIDTNQDGTPDFTVIGVDGGAVFAGDFDGKPLSVTIDSHGNLVDLWDVIAPVNGSSYTLIVSASALGLAGGTSDFDYDTTVFSTHDFPPDDVAGVGHFDSHAPAQSQGDATVSLAPGASRTLTLTLNLARFDDAPSLGWMLVTDDDPNGGAQAATVPVGLLP